MPSSSKKKSKKGNQHGGVSLQHTTVVLDIDVDNSIIKGYVEMRLRCKTQIPTVRIHARQILIEKILFNDSPTTFQYFNGISTPCDPNSPSRSLKTYNMYFKAACESDDKGELLINIPDQARWNKTFTLKVYYVLKQPTAGIHFAYTRPSIATIDDDYGLSASEVLYPPHMFSHNEVESARCWMPCLDRYSQPCTWSFQYRTNSKYIVVSTGELIGTEKITQEHIRDENGEPVELTTYFYEEKIPTTVKNIAVTAGIFEVYPDPVLNNVTYFCLPGKMPMLKHTVGTFHKAFQFYEEYLGKPFPYKCLKVVFVSHGFTKMSSFANLAIMSSHLLRDQTIIDKTIKSRWLLSLALANQWFGNYISVRSWSDLWLRFGLSTHLAGLFFKQMFGLNEYRLRYYKNFVQVAKLDEGRPPINWHSPLHPIQYYQPLILKKSPIVISMLEGRLTPEVFKKILSTIVSPASPKEMKLSTRIFINLLKQEAPGPEIKQFEKQWITGKGCPRMLTGFTYVKKAQETEFVIKQLLSPKDRFSGTMVVRINELDGMYDHPVEFADEIQGQSFHCQSRLRKNRKKKVTYVNGEEIEVDVTQSENPLLWIRVDPHLNWGPLVEFRQPEYMWIYQLEMDRDVVAQYQAIKALSASPTQNGADALAAVIKNPRYFYGVRTEAAHALAISVNKNPELPGLETLLGFFIEQYYDKRLNLVRANDFSDFAAYHVKKAVILAVSEIKDKEGFTPPKALKFLLGLLKNNENSNNDYSDYKYIATIILSLANTNTSLLKNCRKIHKQILRYLKLEKLVPSYQRTITVACLKCLTEMQVQQRLDLDLDIFYAFSRYAHHESVRVAAFKAIILISCPRNQDSLSKVIEFLESPEESPRLKYKVIAAWASFVKNERFDKNDYQTNEPHNIRLCEFMWSYLNSIHSAFDSRLRWAMFDLYKSIWGSDRPACLPPSEEESSLRLSVSDLKPPSPMETEEPESPPIVKISSTKIQVSVSPKPKTKKKSKKKKSKREIPEKEEPISIHLSVDKSTSGISETSETAEPIISVIDDEEDDAPPIVKIPIPRSTLPNSHTETVLKKRRDFLASFSEEGILHIDIFNPEKRRKLINNITPVDSTTLRMDLNGRNSSTSVHNGGSLTTNFNFSISKNSIISASFEAPKLTIRHTQVG